MNSEIKNEYNQLNERMSELKNEMHENQSRMKKIIKQLDDEKKEQQIEINTLELKKIQNYLLENEAYFGKLNITPSFSYMLEFYGIKCYKYHLDNIENELENNLHYRCGYDINLFHEDFDVSNITINNVPAPKNYIEQKIYTKICEYLSNYFPLKIKIKPAYDYGYYLAIENNSIQEYNPVFIDNNFNIYINVYYLDN